MVDPAEGESEASLLGPHLGTGSLANELIPSPKHKHHGISPQLHSRPESPEGFENTGALHSYTNSPEHGHRQGPEPSGLANSGPTEGLRSFAPGDIAGFPPAQHVVKAPVQTSHRNLMSMASERRLSHQSSELLIPDPGSDALHSIVPNSAANIHGTQSQLSGHMSSGQVPAVPREESGLGPLLSDTNRAFMQVTVDVPGRPEINSSSTGPGSSKGTNSVTSGSLGRSPGSRRKSDSHFSFNPFRKRFQKFGEKTVERVEAFQIEFESIKFDEVIGEGGNAAVYRCRIPDQFGERKVAVKCVRHLDNPTDISRETQTLIKEVHILSKDLNHPNIVKLLSVAVCEDDVYIAMELMDGGDLERFFEVRKSERVPIQQSLGWATQLFSALAFLHGKRPKIIHRDLKPANMMLSADCQVVKIGDFGLSRSVDDYGNVNSVPLGSMGKPANKFHHDLSDPGPSKYSASRARDSMGNRGSYSSRKPSPDGSSRSSKSIRGSGSTESQSRAALSSLTQGIGTFRFMAPEMYSGCQFYDEKIDIFSAGLLVWFMVAGKRPWDTIEGHIVAELIGRQRQRPPMDPKAFPQSLIFAIKLAWAHEPSDRPTAQEMLDQLVEITRNEEDKARPCCAQCTVS